ncbi:phosphoesterase [Obelidium mucronatum]|nr:phosphoesterase [Obelidium mucronatum]
MIIVLENADKAAVLADPYFGTTLKNKGYFMNNFFGVSHPSQPNYIAMVAGSYYTCTSDSNCNLAKKNVADLLEAKGLTWKAYNEGIPSVCYTGTSSGKYYRKHNPLISFTNISGNSTRCARIVSSTQLATDEAAGTLPNYMFYTPDQNNDGHDTTIAYASNWLKGFLEPKLTKAVYANTLFHVVFDESKTSSPNNIYSLFIGKGMQGAGLVDNTLYNHYSALRTIENIFGLGNMGQNDATATPIPFVC